MPHKNPSLHKYIFAGIIILLLVTSCKGGGGESGNSVHIVDVKNATASTQKLRSEEFPLPNCYGAESLSQTLGNKASTSKSITLGSTATIEGGGEIEIPEIAKVNLQAAIEETYAQEYESAKERMDQLEMSAAPGTDIVYVIDWYAYIYTSTIQYTVGNDPKIYTAPYTYTLEVPKLNTSYKRPCDTPTVPETDTPQQTFLGGGAGQLVFSALKEGSVSNYEIYLLNLGTGIDAIDSAHLRNLSDNLAPDEDPAWSPDGNQIIFVSRRDSNPEVYRMDANGSHQINLTRDEDRDYQPVWSPDGTYIAFASYRGPGADLDIFIMDADGSNVQQITQTGTYYQDPAWSADGREVFFVAWKTPSGDKTEIYAYNINTQKTRQVTDLGKLTYAPSASPDGQWLLFTSSYSGFQNLFRIGVDGYNKKQLTDQIQTQYLDPAWSPDGQWIAFVAEGKDANTLCLYNVQTEKIYEILSLPGLHSPAWRP